MDEEEKGVKGEKRRRGLLGERMVEELWLVERLLFSFDATIQLSATCLVVMAGSGLRWKLYIHF